MLVSDIKSDFTFDIFLKFRYKETYGTITSENNKLVAIVTPDNLGN